MNEKLNKLANRDIFRNSEIFSFFKLFQDLAHTFYGNLPGIPDENPDDLMVRSSPESVLSTSLAVFDSNLNSLENLLELPRKFIETEEMAENIRLRVIVFGMIKKIIYGIYIKDKNNTDAQTLWFVIRIYKNISLLKNPAIHARLLKFVADMESDTYKAHCNTLKLTNLITQLKDMNLEFEKLLIKRSEYVNKNYRSVRPNRKVCESNYLTTFDLINSIISLDPITDYSPFITKLNGVTSYYNDIAYIKISRRKNKKKPGSEDPDPLE